MTGRQRPGLTGCKGSSGQKFCFDLTWCFTLRFVSRLFALNSAILLHYFIIDCTLPTLPSVSRTLIPWGWVELLVRISLTMPSVNMPLRWCCFKTIFTRMPDLIWLLCWLGSISSHTRFAAYSAFAQLFKKWWWIPEFLCCNSDSREPIFQYQSFNGWFFSVPNIKFIISPT